MPIGPRQDVADHVADQWGQFFESEEFESEEEKNKQKSEMQIRKRNGDVWDTWDEFKTY